MSYDNVITKIYKKKKQQLVSLQIKELRVELKL